MKRLILLLLLAVYTASNINAQFAGPFRNTFYDPDTLKQPFKATWMSLTPDFTVFFINRYLKKSDFAYINGHSVTMNFMFTSLWDNDMFGTNLLAHPFHGSMDYSGARVSGMNHWECMPYVFGASFLWEMVLENEPASFNDQIATTFGGSILGEVSYRVSSSIVDNNAHGFNRIVREIFGALTCPMNGVNRLITGEMWKKRPYRRPNPDEIYPINFGIGGMSRYTVDLVHDGKTRWSPGIHGWFHYGDPFRKENHRAFDFFRIDFYLDPATSSNFLSEISATGSLWTKDIPTKKEGREMIWGAFQHFRYMDNDPLKGDTLPPFRYSEPASFGLGFLMKQKFKNQNEFNLETYANAVILAGAQASYFFLKGRDYNFGQGYSLKMRSNYSFLKRLRVGLDLDFMQFFTWKGYKKGINVSEQDFRTLNAMGDKGNTVIGIIKPYLDIDFSKNFSFQVKTNLFFQKNHNCQFENTSEGFCETNLGIIYRY